MSKPLPPHPSQQQPQYYAPPGQYGQAPPQQQQYVSPPPPGHYGQAPPQQQQQYYAPPPGQYGQAPPQQYYAPPPQHQAPTVINTNLPLPLPIGAKFTSSPISTFQIKIFSARNLIAADISTSDPYVKIKTPSTTGKELKTKVQTKTLNPLWNETFQVDLGNCVNDLIILEVYDHDKIGSDDMIGFLAIDPSKFPRGVEVLTTEQLSFVPHGEITISITAINFGIELPPHSTYKQDYERYRSQLPSISKKGNEKLKNKHKKDDKKAKKQKPSGIYTSKYPPQGYSIVNGYCKKNKSQLAATGSAVGKGLKKGIGKLF